MDGAITIAIYLVVWVALLLPPVIRILDRVGHSRWFAVIVFIPLVNLFGLWMLAFGKWPAMEPPAPRDLDQWSDADNRAFKELLDKQRRS
jgi:hypothetical protein